VNAPGYSRPRTLGVKLFAGLASKLADYLAYRVSSFELVWVGIKAEFDDAFERKPALFYLIVLIGYRLLLVIHQLLQGPSLRSAMIEISIEL